MLAYILAVIVALGSLYIYLTAFIAPDLHRKDDFLWSGVGLFYALVLWFCAGRFTGAILLGQSAAVALLLAFGWETRKLRQSIAHPEITPNLQQGFFLMELIPQQIAKLTKKKTPKTTTTTAETKESITSPAVVQSNPQTPTLEIPETETISQPEKPKEEDSVSATTNQHKKETQETQQPATETILNTETQTKTQTVTEAVTTSEIPVPKPPQKEKKPFFLTQLFGRKNKSLAQPNVTSPASIVETIETVEKETDTDDFIDAVEAETSPEALETASASVTNLESQKPPQESDNDDSEITETAAVVEVIEVVEIAKVVEVVEDTPSETTETEKTNQKPENPSEST